MQIVYITITLELLCCSPVKCDKVVARYCQVVSLIHGWTLHICAARKCTLQQLVENL